LYLFARQTAGLNPGAAGNLIHDSRRGRPGFRRGFALARLFSFDSGVGLK